MSKQKSSSLARLGVAAALVLMGAGSAHAADPRPATKQLSDADDPRRTPEEQKQTRAHEEFERQRELAKKTMRYAPPLKQVDPAAKTQELRGIVEQVRDGRALVSTPLDPAMRPLLARGGFREVHKKEQVNDRTIFNGRVVRAIRIESADWSPFERVVGKEVILTLKPTASGGSAASAVRPVR